MCLKDFTRTRLWIKQLCHIHGLRTVSAEDIDGKREGTKERKRVVTHAKKVWEECEQFSCFYILK